MSEKITQHHNILRIAMLLPCYFCLIPELKPTFWLQIYIVKSSLYCCLSFPTYASAATNVGQFLLLPQCLQLLFNDYTFNYMYSMFLTRSLQSRLLQICCMLIGTSVENQLGIREALRNWNQRPLPFPKYSHCRRLCNRRILINFSFLYKTNKIIGKKQ